MKTLHLAMDYVAAIKNEAVVLYFEGDGKVDLSIAGHVKLVEIIAENCTIEHTVLAEPGAKAEVLQFFMHGVHKFSHKITLGDEASCRTEAVFVRSSDTYIYDAQHIGKKSESVYSAGGFLSEKCERKAQLSIEFSRGASGAVGYEHEDFMLLGDDCRYSCRPRILCKEEDADGRHGFTSGHIDAGEIKYLESRGLSMQTIRDVY